MKITKRARAFWDLDEIAEFIGRTSPPSALRFLEAFDKSLASIAHTPLIGALYKSTDSQLQDVRSWPVAGFEKYLIFYRQATNKIEVLRVLHGARDIETIFEEGKYLR